MGELRVLHALAGFDGREAQGASVVTIAGHVPGEHHLVSTRAVDHPSLASVHRLGGPLRRMWAQPARLADVVREVRPDVVHVHGGPFAMFGAASSWTGGVPVVASLYSWPTVTPSELAAAVRTGVVHAARTPVLAPRTWGNTALSTAAVARSLRRHGVGTVITPDVAVRERLASRAVVTALYLGVTEPRERSEEAMAGRFVFAGRAELTRGPDLLARAVRSLRADGRPVTAELQLLSHGAVGRVRHRCEGDGVDVIVDQPGLSERLAAATAVVLPFRHHHATLRPALVAAEAQALGVPLIVSDAHCLGGLVTDGVDGFVVPRGDVAALAAALARFVDEPGLRSRMGAAAWEESQRRWSVSSLPAVAAWAYERARGGAT